MVSNDGGHLPAGSLGLLFHFDDQIHAFSRIRASIQDVSRLDHVGLAADPPELVVHEPGVLTQRNEVVVGTMNVTDGHDAGGVVPFVRNLFRVGGLGGQAPQSSDKKGPQGGRSLGEMERAALSSSWLIMCGATNFNATVRLSLVSSQASFTLSAPLGASR